MALLTTTVIFGNPNLNFFMLPMQPIHLPGICLPHGRRGDQRK
jgi:hypothetical protein